jgi:hypothetical protein
MSTKMMEADVRALHSDEQTIRVEGDGPRRHFEVCRDGCHVASTLEESPLVLRFFKPADQDMGYTLRNADVHYVEGLHHFWKCAEKEVNWALTVRSEDVPRFAERSQRDRGNRGHPIPRMDVRVIYSEVTPYWTKPFDYRQSGRIGYKLP